MFNLLPALFSVHAHECFGLIFFERVGCQEMTRLVGLPNIFQNAYFDYILAVFLVLGVAEQGLLHCIALSNVLGKQCKTLFGNPISYFGFALIFERM